MRFITLSQEQVHCGNLILINREHPLDAIFTTETAQKNLVPLQSMAPSVLLNQQAAIALQSILFDLNCKEQIVAVSGYRTEQEQTEIYQSSLLENGSEFTSKYVALPNRSEHQSGLAIDLALQNRNGVDFIRPSFPYTGICASFRQRALHLGFIERYPKGKEKITGIAHEPWHFRYVGAPHASIMWELNLTLEEYLQLLEEHAYWQNPLKYRFGNVDLEISYLSANEKNITFEIDDDLACSVSGDNKEGFIITIWRARTK